jgi:uncharacterized damage-inducible protein DinB
MNTWKKNKKFIYSLGKRYIASIMFEGYLMTKEKDTVWITSGLLSQFVNTWNMLREAIANVPDEFWYGTEHDWNYALTVYHIIETQEFYLGDNPKEMVWGKLLGKKDNEEATAQDKYPSKESLLDYLAEIEERIQEYLKHVTLTQLLEKDGFKWFSSIFQKWLYLLRHNAHHLGELGRMLREWECKRMKWQ